MDYATENSQCKYGWPTVFYPYSKYTISNDNVILAGSANQADPLMLMRALIEESTNATQSGGSIKELKKFRIDGKGIIGGFKKMEKKMDQYIRKNNLDMNNKIYIMTLKSLDSDKFFIKEYRKKNL